MTTITTTTTNQFTVKGKLSGADYVFSTHLLPKSSQGEYPCFAAPLFEERGEDAYSFCLLKCRVFPQNAKCTSFFHAYRVFLVTKTHQWIGCVGVAEYDNEPNFEDIDRLLDAQKCFSLIPLKERFVFYPESYWEACRIPAPAVEAEEKELATATELKKRKRQEDSPPVVFGFQLGAEEEGAVKEAPAPGPTPAPVPAPVRAFRFPDTVDDMWFTDFYPLEVDAPASWREMDAAAFTTRFWYLFRVPEYPKYLFTGVFPRFLCYMLEKGVSGKSDLEKDELLEAMFGNNQIRGSASLRSELDEKTKQKVMQEWSMQSVLPDSALNKFRFERFDYFFDRLGRCILELIPWGQPANEWLFVSPLLESTMRECFVYYAADHTLCKKGNESRRKFLRVANDWDVDLLHRFAVAGTGTDEKTVWRKYQEQFKIEPVDAGEAEEGAGGSDWLFGELFPFLAKTKFVSSGVVKRDAEAVHWLSKLLKREKKEEDRKLIRRAAKVCMLRDILRGEINVRDYLFTELEKKNV